MMIWLGYLRPLVSAGIGECSRPTRWYHWYLYSYFTLSTYLWFSYLLFLLFNSHSLFLVLLLLNILYIYFFSQIHDVCLRVSFDLNPSSWTLILDSFTKMLQYLIHTNAASVASVMECLHTIKFVYSPFFFPQIPFLCICIIQCPVLSFKFGIASLSIYDFCSLFFAVHTSYQSILQRICIPTSNNYVLTSTFRASDVLLVYIIENVHHLKIPNWWNSFSVSFHALIRNYFARLILSKTKDVLLTQERKCPDTAVCGKSRLLLSLCLVILSQAMDHPFQLIFGNWLLRWAVIILAFSFFGDIYAYRC